jgi:L-ascorbate metabolism protein UlaG (beta-lactamase superfamily)
MRLTWLGHSGFRIELADQVLLLDPWLTGNPRFPANREAEAIQGATAILLTHGHGDHASDAARLSRATGAPVLCGFELSELLAAGGVTAEGFARGGTLTLGGVRIAMVPASHSNSVDFQGGPPQVAGSECGFVLMGGGRTVYVSGDTGLMADMEWIGAYYRPDTAILACGGRYTMDTDQAAWAVRRWFDVRTVVPCHWGTLPVLAPSVDDLADKLPGLRVVVPQVMVPVEV